MQPTPTTPNIRTLDMRRLREKIPLGSTAIRQKVAKGELPAPFKAGRKLLWYEDEIDSWLAERAAHRVTFRPYIRRNHGAAQIEGGR